MPMYNYSTSQYNKMRAAALRLQKQRQDAAYNARLGERGYCPGGHSGGARPANVPGITGPVVV